VKKALRAGRLVQVLPDWESVNSHGGVVYAVSASAAHVPARSGGVRQLGRAVTDRERTHSLKARVLHLLEGLEEAELEHAC
jgi:hypothetical protein